MCFGLFVPRRARVKDIPGYHSSCKIGVASRQCTTVPVAPPGGGKNPAFFRFFVSSVPLFRSLMLTPMPSDTVKHSNLSNYTQGCPSLRVVESTTGVTHFQCAPVAVGYFTSPGIDAGQIEGADGFLCLLRKTMGKRSKRNCQSSGVKLLRCRSRIRAQDHQVASPTLQPTRPPPHSPSL